ncbi:antitoxin VapB family protein [Candidatus Woesearchaeota archaeon]|nr:antitoxin VapB family protein [Candidatus Woesearchaeota archaeon]
MATKTLTITEDAYDLLAQKKLRGESFSQTIRRVLEPRRKRPLEDFFGIISDKEGEAMLRDLARIKKEEIALMEKRA